MTLFELFIEYGNPADTYSDEVLARFLDEVDDGSMFMESLAEMPEDERKRMISLVDDRTSRTLSHQLIGKIATEQLQRYVRSYLQKKYEALEPEIRAFRDVQEADAARDRAFEASRDKGYDGPSGQLP